MQLRALSMVQSRRTTDVESGPPVAPSNTVLPSITGNPYPGQTLSVLRGTWAGTRPLTYEYQWLADGDTIPGAQANTFEIPDETYLGVALSCVVSVTNEFGGPVSAVSNELTVIEEGEPAQPVNTIPPVMSGDPYPGETLTVTDNGTWTGFPPPTYTYMWVVGGGVVAGPQPENFIEVSPDWVGNEIKAVVIASNGVGVGVGVYTNAMNVTAPLSEPACVGSPYLYGIPNPNEIITCYPGTWIGNPYPTFTYQWREDGVDIPGETGPSFTVPAAPGSLGKQYMCWVTGTNSEGDSGAESDSFFITLFDDNIHAVLDLPFSGDEGQRYWEELARGYEFAQEAGTPAFEIAVDTVPSGAIKFNGTQGMLCNAIVEANFLAHAGYPKFSITFKARKSVDGPTADDTVMTTDTAGVGWSVYLNSTYGFRFACAALGVDLIYIMDPNDDVEHSYEVRRNSLGYITLRIDDVEVTSTPDPVILDMHSSVNMRVGSLDGVGGFFQGELRHIMFRVQDVIE